MNKCEYCGHNNREEQSNCAKCRRLLWKKCSICGNKFEIDPFHLKAEWCWECIIKENKIMVEIMTKEGVRDSWYAEAQSYKKMIWRNNRKIRQLIKRNIDLNENLDNALHCYRDSKKETEQ